MLESAVGDRWPSSELDALAEVLADCNGRFPAGMRGFPPELVKIVQRERVLCGMLRAVAKRGYRDVVIEDVIKRAGVSRPTFYVSFENKEDCFLMALDAVSERLRERVDIAAREAGESWRDRLRAGLEEVLCFIADEPDAAYTLIVESRGAGPTSLLRRDKLLDHFAGCIDAQAREQLSDPPSAIAAAGVVGGIEAVLYSRLRREEGEELGSLLPSLMYFAVLPYVGPEGAAGELTPAALA